MTNEPSLEENIKPKTLSEMEALAKQLFGETAEVHFYGNQWVIETGVEERLDLSEFENTPAMTAYRSPEYNYGSDLERWMYKNGLADAAVAEGMKAYNRMTENHWKEAAVSVRQWIAEEREFDWPGGPEYRDQVLQIAKENGW